MLEFLAENCQRIDCMLSDFSNVFQVKLAELQHSFRIIRVIRRELRCDARDLANVTRPMQATGRQYT